MTCACAVIITVMQYQTSRSHEIYYETHGSDDAPPVLLIHGSTLTGHQDFCIHSNLAERLARRYRVIVPDCQGHGRSEALWETREGAPDVKFLKYAFADMARDCAELLAGLRAAPAFVIGHSNGGNVALYLAKEHADVTRAAVLLAANGHIDEYIRTRVPVGMNPQRVERDAPEWMREMIELHDRQHGDGYWRELLAATVEETVTHPYWSAADLAPMRVACLCVQGENDTLNQIGRHAQTLAEWIPGAELWIPADTGHSVHYEKPDEFERRVTDFFMRRG